MTRLRLFRPDSIRSKIVLSFLVLSLVPMILLAIFSYRSYLNILQRNVDSYTGEVINRVARNLQIYLKDLELILQLREDYYNLQFIKLSQAGDIEGNRKYTYRLWENFNNIKKLKTHLRDISLVTRNGLTICCNGVYYTDLDKHKLYQVLAKRGKDNNSIVLWEPHPYWTGGHVFTAGQAIFDNFGTLLGIMNIDIDVALLDQICRNTSLGKTGYIMLVDGSGKIIYHPDKKLIGEPAAGLLNASFLNNNSSGFFTTKIGGEEHLITFQTFAPSGWKIVGLSNKDELTWEMNKVSGITLALILCSITIIIIVAFFLSGLLTKPIKELQHSMKLAADNLDTNVPVRTNDEIGQLADSFNKMLARIRRLMEKSVEEQKKLRRTEMIALQEQIKPHFIYNTLDLIIGLLETNKNEDVIEMVEALGAFFRNSLSHGQEFIPVRNEVEHIRNYLYIQKSRHGDKYDYHLEVEEEIMEYKTLKLILQPLVENAIYHGVRELDRPGGMIIVKGYRDNGQIVFEVLDNGVGMDDWKMREINRCLREDSPEGREELYFGLRNVNDRIRLAYGKEYGLTLFHNPGGGVRVVVRLSVTRP